MASEVERTFVGREQELLLLDEVIEHIEERGAALLIRGEGGIGKSSLLAYGRARAGVRGMLILSVTGAQSEAHLPFAGMHQLVRPILDGLAELPDPQREALLAAFGLIPAPAPDFFVIAMAALDLLAAAITITGTSRRKPSGSRQAGEQLEDRLTNGTLDEHRLAQTRERLRRLFIEASQG